MKLYWVDVQEIAIELVEAYPSVDPITLSFPDLYNKVLELEGFSDDPDRCGEKVLEAIQAAWIDELD